MSRSATENVPESAARPTVPGGPDSPSRFRLTLTALLAVALLLAAGSAAYRATLLRHEEEMARSGDQRLHSTLPAGIRFLTVALGGFRGIIADILWMRASVLQESGRFFELVQLADWITALEPRFPEVWIFHAWNLSYNISVLFDSPEDRWRWVKHGISLLRDRGIAFNPDEPSLYRELGWIFQHKIGADYDAAHWYYKRAWAAEMERLFPGGRPDYPALLLAPRTEKELQRNPEARHLVEQLRRQGVDPWDPVMLDPVRRPPQAAALLGESPAAALYLNCLRRHVMEQTYKLLPECMQEVEEICGPLDWRLPEAHAAYWGRRGVRVASGFEKLACERMVYQSAADAFRRGRLYYDRRRDLFILLPNLALFDYALKAYDRIAAELDDPAPAQEAKYYFLRMATLYFYVYAGPRDARRVFHLLQQVSPPEKMPRDLESFLVEETLRTSPVPGGTPALLEALLFQSAFWDELDFPQRAAGFRRLAHLLWEHQKQSAPEKPLAPFPELASRARTRAREALALKGTSP